MRSAGNQAKANQDATQTKDQLVTEFGFLL
jgi:hypothetical protein